VDFILCEPRWMGGGSCGSDQTTAASSPINFRDSPLGDIPKDASSSESAKLLKKSLMAHTLHHPNADGSPVFSLG